MRRSFGHLWAPSMRLMVAAFLLALGSSQSPAQGIGGACSQEGQKCYLPYSCASRQAALVVRCSNANGGNPSEDWSQAGIAHKERTAITQRAVPIATRIKQDVITPAT
jgi:hypothetical protein